jgi:hypothetical protein
MDTSRQKEELKRQLKEILVELENESFKNEVLSELKEASTKKSPGFWQHPAFLLVWGFLLTTVLGTWLTLFWQGREQQRQREQLAHERSIQQKYEITDQINKAVADAYTATHVMLHVLASKPSNVPTKDDIERETFWKQAIRTWIPTSLVLQQKLYVNFKDDTAAVEYAQIVDDMEQISVNINETLPAFREKGATGTSAKKSDKELDVIQSKIKETATLADGLRDKTAKLLRKLVDDIHSEENEGTPDSNEADKNISPTAAPASSPR